MPNNLTAGQIQTWDFQADTFEGEYRLIEQTGPDTWLCEHIAPSAAIVDAILATGAEHEARGFSWLGTIEEVMAEVSRREAQAGEQFEIRVVSSATYHAAF